MKMSKIKIFIYTVITITFCLIVGAIIYFTFFGRLTVLLENSDAFYSLDSNEKTYTSTKRFNFVTPGKHTVRAYGSEDDYYEPTEQNIEVLVGKNTTVTINMAYKQNNPDYSGEELPTYNETTLKFVDNLPITNNIGIMYFDYSEETIHFDLLNIKDKSEALRWLDEQGVELKETDIIWGEFIPPDGD